MIDPHPPSAFQSGLQGLQNAQHMALEASRSLVQGAAIRPVEPADRADVRRAPGAGDAEPGITTPDLARAAVQLIRAETQHSASAAVVRAADHNARTVLGLLG